MTIPVIDAVARAYPDTEFTVVSRPFVSGVFSLLPPNVRFLGINPSQYHGLKGLEHLYRDIAGKVRPTGVCDLHDVVRTKYLRLRFMMAGIPVTHIEKDRKARRSFIKASVKTEQTPVFHRYAEAFRRIGHEVSINPCESFSLLPSVEREGVGVAPFAAHKGKVYPISMMEKVVEELSTHTKVYLFGAGEEERRMMEEWENKYVNVTSTVGKLGGMLEELRLIGRLRVMLTMDSGNMHLASLAGTRVISIWGATHPMGGFMGWGQKREDAIDLPLQCRPCSVYGNRPCRFGDFPCMTGITTETIVSAVTKAIGK